MKIASNLRDSSAQAERGSSLARFSVEHVNYNIFKLGRIGHPDYDSNFLINRRNKIGMVGQLMSGEQIKIVEYRGCYDIDVLVVESNRLIKGTTFDKFKK